MKLERPVPTATPQEIAEAILWKQRRHAKEKEQQNLILKSKIKAAEEKIKVAKGRADAEKQKQSGEVAEREYAAVFARFLMKYGSEDDDSEFYFGRCELSELLDFIYGGPPKSDKERLNND